MTLARLPMPSSVQARIRSDRATWAALTAGTPELEGVAVDRVAADPSVLDTETETLYGDGVQCDRHSVDGLSGGREDRAAHVTPAPAAEAVRMSTDFPGQPFGRGDTITYEPNYRTRDVDSQIREAERQAFLRRVQYVDPRERRA